jgi:hypothetical protein
MSELELLPKVLPSSLCVSSLASETTVEWIIRKAVAPKQFQWPTVLK